MFDARDLAAGPTPWEEQWDIQAKPTKALSLTAESCGFYN
jgi:hypothetical protein